MKKLVMVLVYILILVTKSNAQAFTPRTNGTFTPVDPFLSVPKALYIPKSCDTINALNGGRDTVGALVFDTCNHKVWIRDRIGTILRWKQTSLFNKTADTIIAPAIRTKSVISDTLNDPDFEIDVLPDQQYISHGNADSSLMGNAFNWMVNNRINNNLKAVLQVGDLTDDGFASQFVRVDSNFDKLDAVNIPYLYCPGNHDYANGVPTNARNLTQYDIYMNASRYAGKPWFGSNMDGSNANYYIKLDIGKQKFIFVALEFSPRDTALSWANKILDSFPDRRAVIITHGHVTAYGEKSTDTTQWGKNTYGLTNSNDGKAVFDKLLRKHANIFMTLNGHFLYCCGGIQVLNNTNLATPMFTHLTQSGDYGNVINQIAVNYQTDSLGGAGRVMRMKFSPSNGTITVSTYSTINEANDSRFSSFTLGFPEIKVVGTVGVSNGLFVTGETHLNDSVYIQRAAENRLFIAGKNGKLDTLSNSDSAKILFSNGISKKPVFRSLVISDIPTGIPVATYGSVPPASTPTRIGDIYIDIVAKKIYFSTGVASSADWTIIN